MSNMYINIDSLIDTRMPLLYAIDKDLVKEVVTSRYYFNRLTDEFDYLNNKVFTKIYNTRNKLLLSNPLPTRIIELLIDYTFKTKITTINNNIHDDTEIYLNIHPYKLNFKEIDHIRDNIQKMLPTFSSVHIIDKCYKEINPTYLREINVNVVCMYEGMKWLQYHMDVGDLHRDSVPEIMLITPMLVDNANIIKSDKVREFFKDIQDKVKLHIDINFIPIRYFSVMKKE